MIKTTSLTPEMLKVIRDKGTEYPYTGKYNQPTKEGTYLCRQCGLALFRADSQFTSSCGWPSYDEQIKDAVALQKDADGQRTEITCARCDAHLGHVFYGENLTKKNTRFCVNSLSVDFVENNDVIDSEEGIFAAGCFWGVEYYFKRLPGVLKTEVGYSGGHTLQPHYEAVCQHRTGHLEAIRVVFDPSVVSYEQLVKYFFEIHDPTQSDGQGPDLGEQYLSAIFYYNDKQHQIATALIALLQKQHLMIATKLLPVSPFWEAEDYHQHYYEKNGMKPYCHHYVPRFKKE